MANLTAKQYEVLHEVFIKLTELRESLASWKYPCNRSHGSGPPPISPEPRDPLDFNPSIDVSRMKEQSLEEVESIQKEEMICESEEIQKIDVSEGFHQHESLSRFEVLLSSLEPSRGCNLDSLDVVSGEYVLNELLHEEDGDSSITISAKSCKTHRLHLKNYSYPYKGQFGKSIGSEIMFNKESSQMEDGELQSKSLKIEVYGEDLVNMDMVYLVWERGGLLAIRVYLKWLMSCYERERIKSCYPLEILSKKELTTEINQIYGDDLETRIMNKEEQCFTYIDDEFSDGISCEFMRDKLSLSHYEDKIYSCQAHESKVTRGITRSKHELSNWLVAKHINKDAHGSSCSRRSVYDGCGLLGMSFADSGGVKTERLATRQKMQRRDMFLFCCSYKNQILVANHIKEYLEFKQLVENERLSQEVLKELLNRCVIRKWLELTYLNKSEITTWNMFGLAGLLIYGVEKFHLKHKWRSKVEFSIWGQQSDKSTTTSCWANLKQRLGNRNCTVIEAASCVRLGSTKRVKVIFTALVQWKEHPPD